MSKKDKKDLLIEWYDTAQVGDGETVVSSNMPDEFQQKRIEVEPVNSVDLEGGEFEVEVGIKKEPEEVEKPADTIEMNNLRDVYVKASLFFDTLRSYDEALKRGDEPMQTDFIKEKLKNLAVEVMRLTDGIW